MTWKSINSRMIQDIKNIQTGVAAISEQAHMIGGNKFICRCSKEIDEREIDIGYPFAKTMVSAFALIVVAILGIANNLFPCLVFGGILAFMLAKAYLETQEAYNETMEIVNWNREVYEAWLDEYRRANEFFNEQVSNYGWHHL